MAVELLSAAALACLSLWSFFVRKERQELKEHNEELKRELARAIAQRDPWHEVEHNFSQLQPKRVLKNLDERCATTQTSVI